MGLCLPIQAHHKTADVRVRQLLRRLQTSLPWRLMLQKAAACGQEVSNTSCIAQEAQTLLLLRSLLGSRAHLPVGAQHALEVVDLQVLFLVILAVLEALLWEQGLQGIPHRTGGNGAGACQGAGALPRRLTRRVCGGWAVLVAILRMGR